METSLTDLIVVNVPAWELFLRGSVMYWVLFVMVRFVMRREVGGVGIADVLVLVLIANASQNAMAGGYTTLAEGIVLVATIAGWNLMFDWLAFRYRWFATFAEPAALALIRNGRIVYRNLRREFVSVEELMAKLRSRGIEEASVVKLACMEGNGEISIVLFRREPSASRSGRAGGSTG
jgi:uncharacterized membrane protein YcaP (DUF421 family)